MLAFSEILKRNSIQFLRLSHYTRRGKTRLEWRIWEKGKGYGRLTMRSGMILSEGMDGIEGIVWSIEEQEDDSGGRDDRSIVDIDAFVWEGVDIEGDWTTLKLTNSWHISIRVIYLVLIGRVGVDNVVDSVDREGGAEGVEGVPTGYDTPWTVCLWSLNCWREVRVVEQISHLQWINLHIPFIFLTWMSIHPFFPSLEYRY